MICWQCHQPVADGAKFCGNCGASLSGSGQSQGNFGSQPWGGQQPPFGGGVTPSPVPPEGGGAAPKKKTIPVYLLAIIAAVVVVIVVVIILLATRKTTVNLNKYITITDSGYNGYGTVSATFDYDAFESDYLGKIKFNKKNSDVQSYLSYHKSWDDDYDEASDSLYIFEEYIINYCYSLDVTSGLSNDDEVTMTWNYDEDDLDYFKCKVKGKDLTHTVSELEEVEETDLFSGVTVTFYGTDTLGSAEVSVSPQSDLLNSLSFSLDVSSGLSNGDTVTVTASAYGYDSVEEYTARYYGVVPAAVTKTYTVTGLDEITEVDLFADVTLTFSGFSPLGTASVVVNSKDEMVNNLSFSMDVSTNLSNGDVITVTASAPWNDDIYEYCLENYGAAPSSTTKDYTVEGLGYYITELSQMPSATLDKMKSQAEDTFKSQVANNWRSDLTLKSITYLGDYLLVSKNWDRNNQNMYYVVYQIGGSNGEEDFTYYFFLRFDNIVVLDDGTCSVDLSSYTTPSDSFYENGTRFYGYETLDSLFSNCVTKNVEYYTYESSVSMD